MGQAAQPTCREGRSAARFPRSCACSSRCSAAAEPELHGSACAARPAALPTESQASWNRLQAVLRERERHPGVASLQPACWGSSVVAQPLDMRLRQQCAAGAQAWVLTGAWGPQAADRRSPAERRAAGTEVLPTPALPQQNCQLGDAVQTDRLQVNGCQKQVWRSYSARATCCEPERSSVDCMSFRLPPPNHVDYNGNQAWWPQRGGRRPYAPSTAGEGSFWACSHLRLLSSHCRARRCLVPVGGTCVAGSAILLPRTLLCTRACTIGSSIGR